MTGPRIRAAVVLLSVFAVGVLGGIALERFHAVSRVVTMTPEQEHLEAMSELRKELGLDDTQAAAIHEILTEHQDIVQHTWEELRPDVQEAMLKVHEDIAALLNPEQREHFHDWLNHQRELHLGDHSLGRHH